MNIELHLSGLTAEQLIAIAGLLKGTPASVDKLKTDVASKAADKPKEEPKAQANKVEITIEQLTELGKVFAGKNGRDAFVELLGGFGAKNISGVPAEQRAALLAKLEA